MSRTGLRKAALLLTGLDAGTAAELLKSAPAETVTEIAAEMAYLEASGQAKRGSAEQPVRDFFQHLRKSSSSRGGGDAFLRDMLEGVLGAARSKEVLERLPRLVEEKDPFLAMRSVEPKDLGEALKGESAMVAGVVLAELPAKMSAKVLPLLREDMRREAVRVMAAGEEISAESRLRIASLVRRRMQQPGVVADTRRRGQLRKVSLLLRDLGGELRTNLMQEMQKRDGKLAGEISDLMVLWDDLPAVTDRSLQQALRGVDARKLALALMNVDEGIGKKIRGNLSDRQQAALEEEVSLLSNPREEDVLAAREEILKAMRELTSQGLLSFEEA